MNVGRNRVCPCGSGKKYKRCCLKPKASAPVDLYYKIRELEGAVTSKILNFVEQFGAFDFFETAWKEWSKDSLIEGGISGYERQVFVPWYLYCSERQYYGGEIPAQVFLKGRKSSISADERKFVEVALSSPFSFYTVESLEKGHSLTLRDILRQDTTVVRENSGSKLLEVGDIVFGQRVDIGGISFMLGLSPYPFDATELVEVVRLRKNLESTGKCHKLTSEHLNFFKSEVFSLYQDMRHDKLNPSPVEITNTDDEKYAQQKIYFQLKTDIITAFNKLIGLAVCANVANVLGDCEYDSNGKMIKATIPWLRRGNAKFKTWDNTVLGTIEIADGEIEVDVNSDKRAEIIVPEILSRLANMVVYNRKVLGPVKQYEGSLGINVDCQYCAIHSKEEDENFGKKQMELRWREWSVTPSKCLDLKSPVDAYGDEEGRELLEALFRSIEKDSKRYSMPSISYLKELIDVSYKSKTMKASREVLCGRKVSEVFLEYIDPLIVELGDEFTEMSNVELEKFVSLPWAAWNSTVFESVHGSDSIPSELLRLVRDKNGGLDLLSFLVDRKKGGFSQFNYFFGHVSLENKGDGEFNCRAEAKLVGSGESIPLGEG